jgi:hypothetical protein
MDGDPPVHIDLFKGDLLVSTHCLRTGDELEIARQLVPLLSGLTKVPDQLAR